MSYRWLLSWLVLMYVSPSVMRACADETGESAADQKPRQQAWWPQFLGPGGSALASEQTLPLHFGPDENVLWKSAVPAGNSSPVVWQHSIFLTGLNDTHVMVLCYSRADGRLRWKREYPISIEQDYFHTDCSPATATSCTNGKQVVSCFESHGLVAHDLDGNLLWEKPFPAERLSLGAGSSPIMRDGRIYVMRDYPSNAAVLCLDSATGKQIWETPRVAMLTSHSTPCLWRHSKGMELVVAGSGTLDGYDPETGQHVWKVTNLPILPCPSPITQGDLLVFGGWTTAHASGSDRTASAFDDSMELTETEATDAAAFMSRFDSNKDGVLRIDELPASRFRKAFRFTDRDKSGELDQREIRSQMDAKPAPGRNVMVAIRAGGTGDITTTHVRWETEKNLPYVASPLIYRNRVFYVKKGGILTCLDLASGTAPSPRRLRVGGEYYATAIAVGDHVLIAAERGTVFFVTANDEMEIVSKNQFEEQIIATPAVVDNKLYLRTSGHLYAIGAE